MRNNDTGLEHYREYYSVVTAVIFFKKHLLFSVGDLVARSINGYRLVVGGGGGVTCIYIHSTFSFIEGNQDSS